MDINIKKASQSTVNKIKNDIKKQNKAKSIMPPKPEKVVYVKENTFGGLKEIVEMKKNKAVVNELDSLIHEQEVQKNKRNNPNTNTEPQDKKPTPLEVILATDPDRIKNMSNEEMIKLAAMGGGGDQFSNMIMALNMGKKNNNNNGENLSDKLLGMVVEKLFKGSNGDADKSNGDMEMFKLMMQQNMQTQNMMMGIIMKNNEAPAENSNNMFMKEMFDMQRSKSDFENTFMKDKLRELELRAQSNDPLGEAKRLMDYMKTFGGGFGGGNVTPESMNHELKLKELSFEQQRQTTEESRRTQNMEQIGTMINNTIETFGKILGEPIAEAAKSKIEQYSENVKNPQESAPVQRLKISPQEYQKEVDLGDLENLETEIQNLEQTPSRKTKRKPFTVYEIGNK